ncbi:MAG: NADH-quinone oxidoreductase subunit NuoN [Gordonia sp. (in: high G+C Gram-positive bacteria)]
MSTTDLAAISAPSIAYGALSPMLIVFGAGVVGVLVEAFAPRTRRPGVQIILSLCALLAALVAVVVVAIDVIADRGSAATGNVAGQGETLMSGAVILDRPALFLQGLLILVAVAAVAFLGERGLERVVSSRSATSPRARRRVSDGPGAAAQAALAGDRADMFTPSGAAVPNTDDEFEATQSGAVTTEVFPLALLAVGGMMLFVACGDLLTMFIALEVFSLPLYLLCGLARRRRLLSQEASLKYFLLGAFSSAFFLFGAAFVYGAAGSVDLHTVGAVVAAAPTDQQRLALIGLALLGVGLLFKVGAIPFHAWVPDVYQGAPTPVTAFMAAATKIAAFGALARVLATGFGGLADQWRPALWAIAILTMVGGAVMAVSQTDVKRLLAYSAVTHTGFILLGVITIADDEPRGVAAMLFYLAAYGFSTFGAFATVAVVREPDPVAGRSGPHLSGREATGLAQWAGLGRRYPLVGAMFSMFLLAFAGIPLTSGFIAKFAVFAAVAGGGGGVLVALGVLASAIAAYFYIRIIVAMFFSDVPVDNAPHVVRPSALTTTSIAVCTAVTLVLGFFPQPLLDLAGNVGGFR